MVTLLGIGVKKVFDFKFNEDQLKALYLEEVQKRLDKIELQSMLMDSKQLRKMLNLSWPTIEKVFLSDPNFPKMRIGTKWLFNRQQVKEYVDRWSVGMNGKGA
jgi:hypothetical protein